MRNQPFHEFSDPGPARSSLIDPPAALRFRLLAAVFAVPAVIVMLRVAFVQHELQGRYLQVLRETTTEYELIPARDGRILGDAEVFATDVDQYSLEIHYRWLQDPVDPAWLSRLARRSLTRSERRDPALMQDAEARILQQRQDMWSAVMDVTGLHTDAFAARREQIQTAVERVATSVNQRRQRPVDTADRLPKQWYFRLAAQLRQTLTTSPSRGDVGRIVVKEEESHHPFARNVPAGNCRRRDRESAAISGRADRHRQSAKLSAGSNGDSRCRHPHAGGRSRRRGAAGRRASQLATRRGTLWRGARIWSAAAGDSRPATGGP